VRGLNLSLSLLLPLSACTGAAADDTSATDSVGSDSDATSAASETTDPSETGPIPEELDLYGFAGGCYTLRSGDAYLTASGDGLAFAFAGGQAAAARFFYKAIRPRHLPFLRSPRRLPARRRRPPAPPHRARL
jgi:hypothetical protein